MEEDQIIEVWDLFKDYITDKNRETAANHYVGYLLGQSIEIPALEAIMGYDAHLDHAIQLVIDENTDASDFVDEDDWDSYEADEDD